jgi:hypothetical protein
VLLMFVQTTEGTDMEYLHVSIEINGVKLEIIGNYWPGEAPSWDSQGEPESVEIEKILTEKGDDIGGTAYGAGYLCRYGNRARIRTPRSTSTA